MIVTVDCIYENERFYDIPGFSRYVISSKGRIINKRTLHIIQITNWHRTNEVKLYNDAGIRQTLRVGNIVDLIFEKNHKGEQIINCDFTNQLIFYLSHKNRKTIFSRYVIVEMDEAYMTADEVANRLGCDISLVYNVIEGKTKSIKGYHVCKVTN